jgi:prepilin signal peptidase PulO-like enzyme (type II secretory pathway)
VDATAAALFSLAPGLALGSFLNVIAARVPLRRSVVSPASACMSCRTPIAWYDNVPVISWLLLRGRCRHCGAPIAWVYPAVEVVTALLVAGCVLAFGLTLDAVVASFFCAVMVVVSATDLEHRIIPNKIVLPATAIVLPVQTILHPSVEWTAGALLGGGFLLAAAIVYPAGMGIGDVKLAALMGAMVGWTVSVGLMLGMLLALVPSFVLLARHGMRARKMKIPFGPFLALGAVLALFWGDALLDRYLALL